MLALLTLVLTFLGPSPVLANNLAIENVELVDHDADNDTIDIEFDISWSNSWKDSVNHDAVWVFFKYCTANCSSTGTWDHVTLKTAGTNPSGFDDGTKQSGAYITMDLVVPSDKKGVFVVPGHQASGAIDFHNMNVRWDYAADGLSDAQADAATTEIKAVGIEMVLVSEGGFSAGDGSDGTNGELEFGGSAASQAGAVSSEAGLSFGDSATQWYYNTDSDSDDDASGNSFELSASFPKGYQAFYTMKYEISQGQYRDFLNKLTRDQQNTRTAEDVSGDTVTNIYVMTSAGTVTNRQGLLAPASGNGTTDRITFTADFDDNSTGDESTDGEWIAMNYLSWMDLAAYADWAALRPMTELEFEKMARGPISPVDGEYAWGSTTLTQAQGAISNSGETSEVASNTGDGLANYDGAGTDTGGPLRVGFAATASTTTRIAAAAGYYGVMELSGNVWERAVTLGNSSGRGFSGTHGDGTLTTTSSHEGNATNPDWPGLDGTSSARGITGATGSGFRGGAYDETTTSHLETSNRLFAGDTDTTRRADSGGRLVRTAP